MWRDWIPVSLGEATYVLLSVAAIYSMIILFTRVVGLRSFSKMSTGDFAMTVAVGSLFGTAIANPSPTIGVTLVAFLGLFAGQGFLAWSRQRSAVVSRAVDNRPILLMSNGEILHQNLRLANVTESDLIAKLREANALKLEDVKAVVFETTGDVSVLHSASGEAVDPRILAGVVGGPAREAP